MYTIIGGNGKEYGPVSAAQVRSWLAGGRADLDTKAKFLGTEEWKPLGDFPEFTEGAAPAPGAEAGPPPVGAPVDAQALAADLIARAGKLEISRCYERSWELLKANFWPLVGVFLLVLIVESAVSGFTSYRPIPSRPYLAINWGAILLGAIFKGGLYCYVLKKVRGQPAGVADAFAGFALAFLPLLLTGIVSAAIVAGGFLLLILPGIYLAVAYSFAIPLVVDRRLHFWTAMEVSRRVVTAQWWRVFGLMLLAIPFMILGLACLIVGILVAIPLFYGAVMYAYEDLCNPK